MLVVGFRSTPGQDGYVIVRSFHLTITAIAQVAYPCSLVLIRFHLLAFFVLDAAKIIITKHTVSLLVCFSHIRKLHFSISFSSPVTVSPSLILFFLSPAIPVERNQSSFALTSLSLFSPPTLQGECPHSSGRVTPPIRESGGRYQGECFRGLSYSHRPLQVRNLLLYRARAYLYIIIVAIVPIVTIVPITFNCQLSPVNCQLSPVNYQIFRFL